VCARAALRELLRDEVEHPRFGWIYVGRAVAEEPGRAALQEHVLSIVQNVLGCWFDDSASECCVSRPAPQAASQSWSDMNGGGRSTGS
jgi:hypothetical protein